jgi:hypothetical protein
MPKDHRLIQNTKTLFANIPEKHYLQQLYLVVTIYRRGKMVLDLKSSKGKSLNSAGGSSKQDKDLEEEENLRRPFACTLLPLTPDVIENNLNNEEEFQPGTLILYTTPKEEQFYQLPLHIIEGTGSVERLPRDTAIGIGISLKLFKKSLDRVLDESKDTLSLEEHVCITKCLELPHPMNITEQRNDCKI